VATADLNGDGKLDLVVANTGGNTISVLLGNGNGVFKPAIEYTVGTGPAFVAIGDFNHDGKPDLAVAIEGDSNSGATVAILLGNGDGTFRTPVDYQVGTQPNIVAVADFNGDGKPDLAVSSLQSDTVSILIGNGNGTFQPAQFFSTGFAASMVVADFNGDGKPDIAVADPVDSKVSVFLGNGTGRFGPPISTVVNGSPNVMAVGDFDGDGMADLAVANSTGSSVTIVIGNGDGTFLPLQADYSLWPDLVSSIAVADFNRDGSQDLAVTGAGVAILLGKGNGAFEPR
jgi:hypothetical protein